MDGNVFTIYANGRKAKYFNMGLPVLSLFCIAMAVAGFITGNIVIGIIMVAVLILLLILVRLYLNRAWKITSHTLQQIFKSSRKKKEASKV